MPDEYELYTGKTQKCEIQMQQNFYITVARFSENDMFYSRFLFSNANRGIYLVVYTPLSCVESSTGFLFVIKKVTVLYYNVNFYNVVFEQVHNLFLQESRHC